MVSIFVGAGSGFARGSGSIVGGAGLLGAGARGRSGESVSVNAATGNLLITREDEFLIGRGPDASISRTYNSLAQMSDGDNNDNWQLSTMRRVFGLTGTLNAAGSTVSRQGGDGSVIVYSYKTLGGVAAYWATDGDGAHDKLARPTAGDNWTWTDGSSRYTETYEASVGDPAIFRIAEHKDTEGYKLSFTYVTGTDKLDMVTTANHGTANLTTGTPEQSYVQYVWLGNFLSQIVTGYTDYGDAATEADNANKTLTRTWYTYSGGKLARVLTDLTPDDNVAPTPAQGYATWYAYDASGRVNLITQKDGSSLAITYDGAGRVATLTQAADGSADRVTSFTYDAAGTYTDVTGPDLQTTRLKYDAAKQLKEIVAPPASSGAAAQSIKFDYDGDGNLAKVTDAALQETSFLYDANGNLLTSTDANGNIVTRTYGPKNEMLTETRTASVAGGAAAAYTTRYVYSSTNRLRYVISPEARVTEYRYSGGELGSRVGYPEHPYTGGAGNPTEAEMTIWRDGLPDRSSIELATFVSDGRGNLLYSSSYGIASAAGGALTGEGYSRTYLVHDQAGRLLSRNHLGENIETFVYDGLGRLVGSTDLDGGTTTIVFDDPALTTTVTTGAGYTSTSTYNKAGDLVSETHGGSYDVAGTTAYRYDALGRVRMVTSPRGVATTGDPNDHNSFILYDLAGRKTANIAADGSVTEYRYDAAGRVAATVAYAAKLDATKMGNLAAAGGMVEIADYRPGATTSDTWTWNIYDDGGRLVQTIDGDGGVVNFVYDASDRLVKTVAYATKIAIAGFIATPPATPRTVTATGADRISRNFYDADGRLIGVLDGEGYLSESLYDKAGRKVEDIAYATRTSSNHWVSGTLDDLRESAGTAGRSVHYVYDGQGLLRFTVDGGGYVTGYSFNTAGRQRSTIAYATPIATGGDYSYDNVDALITAIADDSAHRRNFTVYNAKGQAAYAVDAGGFVTGFTYDAAGNVIKTVAYATARNTPTLPTVATMDTWSAGQAVNRVTRSWYGAGGTLRFAVDGEGYVTRYDYDADGHLIAERRSPNKVTASDTTTIAQINALTNAAGTPVVTGYAYDPAGRIEYVTDGEGYQTRNIWSGTGELAAVYTAWGTADQSETRYTYDAAGRVLSEARVDDGTTLSAVQYQYTAFGEVKQFTDARGKITTYAYDDRGLRISATDPLGGVTAYAYNGFGDLIKTTDAGGGITRQYYDAQGRLVYTIDAEKNVSRLYYNGFGEVVQSVRYATGFTATDATTTANLNTSFGAETATPPSTAAVSSYTYDTRGLVLTATDPAGTTTSTYNAFGNLLTVARAGATTTFEYDNRGLVKKTTDAEGWFESYGYDAYGNRTSVVAKSKDGTKVAGGTTSYTYDKRGLLLTETLPASSYNADATVQGVIVNSYAYDGRGNRTQMIEGVGLTEARTTTYEYDRLDRLTKTMGDERPYLSQSNHISAATFIPAETIAYDPAGNILRRTDTAGGRSVYFYDDLGRRTVEIDAAGTYTKYAYDANGNVLSTRVYEAKVVSIPSNGGADTAAGAAAPETAFRETLFTYDKLDRLKTSSIAGVTTGSYSGDTWANTTDPIVTIYDYDPFGNVAKVTDPNGEIVWSYYDKAGRKTHQVDAMNYLTTWAYDAEGNVLAETRYANPAAMPTGIAAPPATPAMNAADRITTYTYDKNGNRLSEARSKVLVHNGNGGVTDPNGETVTVAWLYNGLGQVVRKTEATGDQTNYVYDAGGRLLTETRAAFSDFEDISPAESPNATPTVDYRYDGLGNLVQTLAAGRGASTLARETRYIYGAGGLLASMTDAEGAERTYFYNTRGTVIREQYRRAGSAGGTGTIEAVLTSVDALGRTVERAVATWTGSWARGDIAATEYNAYGEVSRSGINGLWQTENQYDAAGRLVATNAGDGVWKQFGYDKAGNRTLALTSAGYDLKNKSLATALGQVGQAGLNATYTVYDARNLATDVVEEGRQLAAGTTATLTSSRSYNAFGEVLTETDALGAVTRYAYNNIGKLIRREAPTVRVVYETGAAQWIKPATDYYYDASGRLVATRDANGDYAAGGNSTVGAVKLADTGNLTRLTLLAGTGYNGSQALVTAETHADNGVIITRYDIHGDARRVYNELNTVYSASGPATVKAGAVFTANSYDKLGRVVQVGHAGGLVDNYAYDSLGQRIKHWTNAAELTGEVEETDYDVQGRVTRTRAFGGDVTTTGYAWDAAVEAIAGTVTGGWSEVTTMANTRTLTEKSDLFGRTTWKEDLGDHVTTYAYDIAGRQTGATMGGTPTSFTWYNTGQLASNSGPNGIATYTYDKAGNRTAELLKVDSVTIKNQTAVYDALGRLTSWAEAGTTKSPAASTTNAYDANGNVRMTHSEHQTISATGVASGTLTGTDHWYRYDSMNRLVTDKGVLSGTAGAAGTVIVRRKIEEDQGAAGSARSQDIAYDLAGQRQSVTTSYHWREAVADDGPHIVYIHHNETHVESYAYDGAGRLATVHQTIDGGTAALRSDFAYDLLGRVTLQRDYGGLVEGTYSGVSYSRSIAYNAKGQVTSDDVSSAREQVAAGAWDTFRSVTTYGYGTGSSYALGSVVTQSATNTKLLTGSGSWTSDPATQTTTAYAWYDGAVQDLVTYDSDTGSGSNPLYTTDLQLNGFGQLAAADVNDGVAKDVAYTLDENGQIIRRDESRDGAPSEAAPHEVFYRFAGREMGMAGNNGTADMAYGQSIADRAAVRPSTSSSTAGLFRNGTKTGSVAYADFAQSYDPYNSGYQGSAGGVYTVRAGDTLASVAATLWGDANLWYKLAEANGMSANSALVEGQTLTLPVGVTRSTHSADTFKPYDPTDALGDLSPTTPKPPKKPKCGVLGQILVAAIAIGLAAWLGPQMIAAAQTALAGGAGVVAAAGGVAAGSAAAIGGGIIGGAAAGALGSMVSQGFGVATGIQSSFSWKGVGLAAVAGGIGGGITGLSQSVNAAGQLTPSTTKLGGVGGFLSRGGVTSAIARGVGTNALTQGIGLATGLQSKFDFAGVAAAAAVHGIGDLASGALPGAATATQAASTGNVILSSAAGAIAGAATRSAITGENFGDNLMRALPDVVANSLILAGRSALAQKGGNDGGGSDGSAHIQRTSVGPVAYIVQPEDGGVLAMSGGYGDFDAQNPIVVTALKMVDIMSEVMSLFNSFDIMVRLGRVYTNPEPRQSFLNRIDPINRGLEALGLRGTAAAYRGVKAGGPNLISHSIASLDAVDAAFDSAWGKVLSDPRGAMSRSWNATSRSFDWWGKNGASVPNMLWNAGEAAVRGTASDLTSGDPRRIESASAGISEFTIGALAPLARMGSVKNVGLAAESGVWKLGPGPRGEAIEQAFGHNLPGNFPIIDRFYGGMATSIKSIDLNAASYLSGNTLNRTLTGYVDKVARFNGKAWAGKTIRSSDITGRGLEIVVPHSGTAAQQATLNQIIKYGSTKGVVVKVLPYP